MKILCIHGIGHQEADLAWQPQWKEFIGSGLRRWKPGLETEFQFLAYDRYFEETPATLPGTLGSIGSLLMSGAIHSIGDIFRRRRGFGDIGEKAKWYAGMVTQWAGDAKLRAKLCAELEGAIETFEPDVICAHSLGSLLAYDLFAEQRKKPGSEKFTFVTFGSQIGNPAVRNAFGGYLIPIGARRWFNLYNRNDDVFSVNLNLAAENYEQVQTPFERQGVGDHDAEGYLTHINAVEGAWRRIASDDLDRPALTSRAFAMRDRLEKSAIRAAGGDAATAAAKTPRRRALLIGINEYPDPDDRLEGCVNDVFLMSSVLQECGFDADDIRVVLDDRATAAGIRERLEWLLGDVRAGDVCFLYYSGHGAQLPGYGAGDTFERLDEILVPWDFDGTRETAVTDDHIFDLYSQLPYDASFIAVFDCCHSGGVARAGGAKVRGINLPDDIRHRMLRWDADSEMWIERNLAPINEDLAGQREWVGKSGATRRLCRGADARRIPNKEFDALCKKFGHKGPYLPLILQACGEDELSYEYRHGTLAYGAFTYSLATILRRLGHQGKSVSYEALCTLIARQLWKLGYQQRPQILGPKNVRQGAVPWRKGGGGPVRRGLAGGRKRAKSAPVSGAAAVMRFVRERLHAYNIHRNPTAGSDIKRDFKATDEEDKATGYQRRRVDDFLRDLILGITHPVNISRADLLNGVFETPQDITDFIVP